MSAEEATPTPLAWRFERRGQDLYAEGPHSLRYGHDPTENRPYHLAFMDVTAARAVVCEICLNIHGRTDISS
jgi:hypothetical protein